MALSLVDSSTSDTRTEGIFILNIMYIALKILKSKLIDYHSYGKPEPLPEYAVHKLIWLLNSDEEMVRKLDCIMFFFLSEVR